MPPPETHDDLRDALRALPVLKGSAPFFDPLDAPPDPTTLFGEWLRLAIHSGVAEPHAMTLSTVDAHGRPSARILILKDIDTAGWHFAVHAASRKGRELAATPFAALTFYWPELVRQVRVSGPVVRDSPEVAAADFLARPAGSREMALTGRQSTPYTERAEVDAALERARQQVDSSPDHAPAEWVSYAVRPDEVEFWQGDPTRRHLRLRYRYINETWSTDLLWP